MEKKWILKTFEDTDLMACEIQKYFKTTQFLGLVGPMGAGKTYFVRSLTKYFNLNSEVAVQSPSFALHQHYENDTISIDHLDLYRLESEEDLESTGFWDLFNQDKTLIIVEWADLLNLKNIPKKFNPLILKFELSSDEPTIRLCSLIVPGV